MYCSNCGREVENNAKFCSNCGQPISKGTFCSNCGAPNAANAEVCARCGTRLFKAEGTSPSHSTAPPPQSTEAPPKPAPPPPQEAPPPVTASIIQPETKPKAKQPVPPPPQEAPPQAPASIIQPETQPKAKPAAGKTGNSPKSKVFAAILALIFGQLGLHRLYAGRKLTTILQLVLTIAGYVTIIYSIVGYFILGAAGIWILIDFLLIQAGKFKDGAGLIIK